MKALIERRALAFSCQANYWDPLSDFLKWAKGGNEQAETKLMILLTWRALNWLPWAGWDKNKI